MEKGGRVGGWAGRIRRATQEAAWHGVPAATLACLLPPTSAKCFTRRESKSEPPRCVSPAADRRKGGRRRRHSQCRAAAVQATERRSVARSCCQQHRHPALASQPSSNLGLSRPRRCRPPVALTPTTPSKLLLDTNRLHRRRRHGGRHPPVAFTSKMPSSINSSDTSKVPPPRSKISTLRPSSCAGDTGRMHVGDTACPCLREGKAGKTAAAAVAAGP